MILIIGAMEEEVSYIRERLTDPKPYPVYDREYTLGKLSGKDVIVGLSGIGKVNAAAGIAFLLAKQPTIHTIIFTGVAGGVYAELNVGDLVIGTDLLYHDFDATALGHVRAEIPREPVSIFSCDKNMSEIIKKLANESIGADKVHCGRIVTGDQFIASREKVQELYDVFNAYAVEMEGAAVAHVAHKCGIPCVVLRVISDKANGEAPNDYESFFAEVAKRSAQLVIDFIKNNDVESLAKK